jgi:hypothetical protein
MQHANHDLIKLDRRLEKDIYRIRVVILEIAMDGDLDSRDQTRNIPDDTPERLRYAITKEMVRQTSYHIFQSEHFGRDEAKVGCK